MQDAGLVLNAEFFLTGAVAGLIGAAVMAGFMLFLTRQQICQADMIRAIGSLFTRSNHSARPVGTLVHLFSGVIFGLVYLRIFYIIPAIGLFQHLLFGSLMGFVHGFAVSLLLVVAVAEHHPLEEFRDAGMGVALAHLFGHVLFGVTVGAVVALFGHTA